MDELNDDDLETLIDALEAWEHKGAAGEMMGELFGALLCRDDPAAKAKMLDERARDKMASERAKAILLRAKLLTIRVDGVVRSGR